ncbi:MAG TPA: type VI secretion system tip protein TssI/VgrG [Bryobacteraceae bacterium]|nr:type VI secretion system tip protein TssI/VgrG [Bryobacteraceae bacterium]
MAFVQDTHRLAIKAPLGDNALLLRNLHGAEAISQLFHFDLELLSEHDSISFSDVVGKNITLKIDDAKGTERHWNGFISRFSQGTQDGRLTTYYAQVSPWLWFLTRTADCRIFQNLKVPDIIRKIFSDLSFSDFEFRLYGSYQPREYCVQYRETDFNFVARLMEEEGIYYFFDHQDGKHMLILADDPAANKPCPGQKTARCGLQGRGTTYKEDLITDWQYSEEFRTGAWAQTDYNFQTPSTSLAVNLTGPNRYEIYDFPGEHQVRSDGDRLSKIRLQEQTAGVKIHRGSSTCRAFTSGFQFTLQDHYRKDLNQAYLLTAIRHSATEGGSYGVGTGSGEELSYRNSFECVPYSVPFRPARVTPQPFVQGCQTAVVVGPGGEEIYTDQHGRVKVQFHWDREGKKNENSSCWIRVSHPWAGQGWGAISIPRIGQEVVVDFLEGNPDLPIIVGRVYNAGQMPPFGMPGGAMISGIKSNSTKGGGGYNEISLNDTKGTELINIHAQYDQQKKVEHDERVNVGNDRTELVGHDEKITIGNNRTEKVGVNESITIGSNRTEKVGSNETISIGSNRTESVGANEAVTIVLTRTHNVGVNDMLNVGGAQEVSVGGAQALTVGGIRAKTVIGLEDNIIGSQNITVQGAVTETTGATHTQTVKADRTASITGADSVGCKTMSITATDSITLTVGDASITMNSDGTITINSKDIKVSHQDLLCTGRNISLKASSDVVIKASKIGQN